MTVVLRDGLADLGFERRGDVTRLTRSVTRSPLTIQRALYPDDACPAMAQVFIANPTAGLLSGDQHTIRVSAKQGAHARVTTQAATKVMSMRDGQAIQDVYLDVSASAILEYLPEPLIPFHGARLNQRVMLRVAEGGTLAYLDVLGAGRVGHGESYAYTELAWTLTLARPSGDELYLESVQLRPATVPLDRLGAMGRTGHTAMGTLLIVTPYPDPQELVHRARGDDAHEALGAAPLPGGEGIVVKALGGSVSEVRDALRSSWERCRELAAIQQPSENPAPAEAAPPLS